MKRCSDQRVIFIHRTSVWWRRWWRWCALCGGFTISKHVAWLCSHHHVKSGAFVSLSDKVEPGAISGAGLVQSHMTIEHELLLNCRSSGMENNNLCVLLIETDALGASLNCLSTHLLVSLTLTKGASDDKEEPSPQRTQPVR